MIYESYKEKLSENKPKWKRNCVCEYVCASARPRASGHKKKEERKKKEKEKEKLLRGDRVRLFVRFVSASRRVTSSFL